MNVTASKAVLVAALLAAIGTAVPSYAGGKSTNSGHGGGGGSGGSTSTAAPTYLSAEGAGHITMANLCTQPTPCDVPTGVTQAVSATLTESASGFASAQPVAGATVTFQLHYSTIGNPPTGVLCTATTNSQGVATCADLTPEQLKDYAGDSFYARFDGEPNVYLPSKSLDEYVFMPHPECELNGLPDCH